MTISPKRINMEEVILGSDNIAEFSRYFEDICDFRFGTPGQNICNGVASGMRRLPTQDSEDASGKRLYRATPADPTQLMERDYVLFLEDKKRALKINDKYQEDDIDCVSYLMMHISQSVATALRNSPSYKAYKAMPEGDRSYSLFQAIKKIVSTPDVNSIVTRACNYLGIQFSININQTMDMVNVRSEQFKADFATSEFPDSVSFDKLKSMVVFSTLNKEAFHTFKQVYSAGTQDPLGDSEKLMQAAITYASANKQYIDSFPGPDLESERGQAYFASGESDRGLAYHAGFMGSIPVSEFLQSSQGLAYKAELKRPGGEAYPLQHPAPFCHQLPFRLIGPPVTDAVRFCHDCYIRTGKCITSHGNPGQSKCYTPSLERNPETTAIKSYVAEMLINPFSSESQQAFQLLDQLVTKCD
jgi:hypothetical protein